MVELALMADRRDLQRAFRDAWGMPYAVLPRPGADAFPCIPMRAISPGPYPVDEAELQRGNERWAAAMTAGGPCGGR
jgi:hypothetical protein